MARSRINVQGLNNFNRELRRGGGLVRQMYKLWGTTYLEFIRNWFLRNARGGGRWKGLKRATEKAKALKKAARKGFQGDRKSAILIQEGDLFGALKPGAPGNEFRLLRRGIRVGFNNQRHPSSKLAYRQLAIIHEKGKAKGLPKRLILIRPDRETIRVIRKITRTHMARLGRQSERKVRRR